LIILYPPPLVVDRTNTPLTGRSANDKAWFFNTKLEFMTGGGKGFIDRGVNGKGEGDIKKQIFPESENNYVQSMGTP
jgi:hypothetical protein